MNTEITKTEADIILKLKPHMQTHRQPPPPFVINNTLEVAVSSTKPRKIKGQKQHFVMNGHVHLENSTCSIDILFQLIIMFKKLVAYKNNNTKQKRSNTFKW